mgnify:CR=1 FL=1
MVEIDNKNENVERYKELSQNVCDAYLEILNYFKEKKIIKNPRTLNITVQGNKVKIKLKDYLKEV